MHCWHTVPKTQWDCIENWVKCDNVIVVRANFPQNHFQRWPYLSPSYPWERWKQVNDGTQLSIVTVSIWLSLFDPEGTVLWQFWPVKNSFVTMADTGLLVDISDPGGGDSGGSLGPLNLRRGRNSLASSHPKTLEVVKNSWLVKFCAIGPCNFWWL